MKNDYLSILRPTVSIVNEASFEANSKSKLNTVKCLSEEEKRSKIVNTTYNKKWPDGRIYGVSKDGSYTSHSVSPYSKVFLDNLEEKIKPLVLALKEKGYLSLSSCEGHSIYFRRYVTLIFPSQETALEFQSSLPFNHLKFDIKHCTEFLNNRVEADRYGRIVDSKKEVSLNGERDGAVKYINAIANRSYRDAWLLDLVISDQVQYTKGLGKYFRNWKEIIFKTFFIDLYTKNLTRFIKEKLKANIY